MRGRTPRLWGKPSLLGLGARGAGRDQTDGGLPHPIHALGAIPHRIGEAKFLSPDHRTDANRHATANVVFDVGGLVAAPRDAPSVNAQQREITRLPFSAPGACDQVLRLMELLFVLVLDLEYEPHLMLQWCIVRSIHELVNTSHLEQ